MRVTVNSPVADQIAELHRLADEAYVKANQVRLEAYRLERLAADYAERAEALERGE